MKNFTFSKTTHFWRKASITNSSDGWNHKFFSVMFFKLQEKLLFTFFPLLRQSIVYRKKSAILFFLWQIVPKSSVCIGIHVEPMSSPDQYRIRVLVKRLLVWKQSISWTIIFVTLLLIDRKNAKNLMQRHSILNCGFTEKIYSPVK